MTNITQYVDFLVLLSQRKDPAAYLQHNVLNIFKIAGLVLAQIYIALMLVQLSQPLPDTFSKFQQRMRLSSDVNNTSGRSRESLNNLKMAL